MILCHLDEYRYLLKMPKQQAISLKMLGEDKENSAAFMIVYEMSTFPVMRIIATLGFIGYLPFAPGTFGSLVAMVFFVTVKPSPVVHLVLVVAITLVGTIASHHAEKLLKEKDSGHIIIDEFAGYSLSVILLPAALHYFIAAFLLFRFFDILKPPPIRWIERILPGGIAIMADDLMAGIYTNALLQIWILLA